MENIAILISLIIKYGILLICLLGLLRIWILRNDKRIHYITIIITSIFTFLTLYIFGGGYLLKRKTMKEISGDFKLTYYKCEKCPECIVKLNESGTYILLQKGNQVEKGNWDYTSDLSTIFLEIENGSDSEVLDSTRTLSAIKNKNCQEYWRNENLKTEFDGIILHIDTLNKGYGLYSFILEDEKTKKRINYEPKYIGHPWLNEKLKVGDKVMKKQNSMKFIIKNVNNQTIEINED